MYKTVIATGGIFIEGRQIPTNILLGISHKFLIFIKKRAKGDIS